jgi:poly(beta-D-mannuronate) lyase
VSTWLLLLTFFFSVAVTGEPLHSPWQHVPIPQQESAPYDCPPERPLPRVLVFDGYYTDSHYSIKDAAAVAAYSAAVSVPEDFARNVVHAADNYRTTGSLAAGRCAITMLSSAAAQQAFTEPHLSARKSRQGFYVQTWLCAGLSLAYLKVEGTNAESPGQHEAITAWLAALGEHVENFQDRLVSRGSGDSQNNHHYWAGLAVAAAGVARNRIDLFHWGIEAGRDGLRRITPDGTLPLEMDRRSMALHYHLFAAAPLVLLAELGQANGIDLYKECNGALRRLVLRAASGLEDPSFFEKQTGVAQQPQNLASAGTLAWAIPFSRRFPNPMLQALLAKAQKQSYWMFGGLPPP